MQKPAIESMDPSVHSCHSILETAPRARLSVLVRGDKRVVGEDDRSPYEYGAVDRLERSNCI